MGAGNVSQFFWLRFVNLSKWLIITLLFFIIHTKLNHGYIISNTLIHTSMTDHVITDHRPSTAWLVFVLSKHLNINYLKTGGLSSQNTGIMTFIQNPDRYQRRPNEISSTTRSCPLSSNCTNGDVWLPLALLSALLCKPASQSTGGKCPVTFIYNVLNAKDQLASCGHRRWVFHQQSLDSNQNSPSSSSWRPHREKLMDFTSAESSNMVQVSTWF